VTAYLLLLPTSRNKTMMAAMHVPDGFLDVPTSIATGAVAFGVVGLSLQRANREIRESGPALAGLTAAFIFAVQMVNFPIGAGTSGHLLGGALAAALVGPWTGVLCMTVVLLVQGLLFADGGLTALGTNVTVMGLTTVLVGFVLITALLRMLPKRTSLVGPAAGLAAFVSVPVAALVFTLLYAVGGAVSIPLGTLATAMVGWHVLIGIGEAVITAAVVGAVVATRPDLVHVARHLRPVLVLVDADGNPTETVSADAPVPGRPGRRPLAIGLLTTLVVAGVVSFFASAHPDGLEFVGEQLGISSHATESAVAGSPLADYGVSGIGNSALAGGLAGIIGVCVVLAVLYLIASFVRRRATSPAPHRPQARPRVDA
jgi:cobalt/nickel transport system permease protein